MRTPSLARRCARTMVHAHANTHTPPHAHAHARAGGGVEASSEHTCARAHAHTRPTGRRGAHAPHTPSCRSTLTARLAPRAWAVARCVHLRAQPCGGGQSITRGHQRTTGRSLKGNLASRYTHTRGLSCIRTRLHARARTHTHAHNMRTLTIAPQPPHATARAHTRHCERAHHDRVQPTYTF